MKLTPVERAVVAKSSFYKVLSKTDAQFFRAYVRGVAFHEAAHVVARKFTGFESGHLVHVTIIPDDKSLGHERIERCFAESSLSRFPEPLKLAQGRCLLLNLLAGRGAEGRTLCRMETEDILNPDSEQWEEEGTDLFRALRVAEIMARPFMPASRILGLAAKWTEEMLAVPEVWDAIERLSELLLDRGEIKSGDDIDSACEKVLWLGLHLPKWRRRLCIKNEVLPG